MKGSVAFFLKKKIVSGLVMAEWPKHGLCYVDSSMLLWCNLVGSLSDRVK